MSSAKTDRLGRATFHHIAPQSGVRPTKRELRWLKHIERHGPQSSQYLYALTRDTHRCKDTALRNMQKLRASDFLRLPPQQRTTERAEFNPYIYDLTNRARAYLADLGLAEQTIRPTGHWWHGYAVSCVSSSIDIAAGRNGVRYIPAHDILAIRGANLAIPVGRAKLIPDQLFALDYGGRYRAFVLEIDRGTEPKVSGSKRKSWASSIELYRKVIERRLWKSHYGLKANLLVLWVFPTDRHRATFLDLVRLHASDAASSILATSGDLPPAAIGQGPDNAFYHDPWHRASGLPTAGLGL